MPVEPLILPALGADLLHALPLVWLFGWALLVLLGGAFLPKLQRWLPHFTLLGLAVALLTTLPLLEQGPREAFAGMARLDGYAGVVIVVLLVGAALCAALLPSHLEAIDAHLPETWALLLFALLGMVGLAVAADLLFLFVALEVMSVAAYVLAALNRGASTSVEAGIKYFVMGAFSSAILLYGVVLVYGATGGTGYTQVALALGASGGLPVLLRIGLALVLAGLAFKVAAVPFHTWVPDVYQGAPAPITAFFATGVKVASFAALFRLVAALLLPDSHLWGPVLAAMAVASLLLGNLGALVQQDLKRMLAYSAIGHTGFLLMGLAGLPEGSLANNPHLHGILFYFLAYTLAVAGCFAVVGSMVKDGRELTSLDGLRGLARQRPFEAVALGICLLSLAGLPPSMGFLAKLYMFLASVETGRVWLAVVGAVAAVVAVAAYMRPVVVMFMSGDDEVPSWRGELSLASLAVLTIATTLLLLLGLVPGPLVHWCQAGLLAMAG